jgi:hypothetical protein
MSNKQSDSLNTIVYRQDKHIPPQKYMYDYKMEYIIKFRKAYLEEPTIRKRVLCKKIGISESTLNRFMKDLNMLSFYTYRSTKDLSRKNKANNGISTDEYKNKQSAKVKNKHKTRGKPTKTKVKLFKCVENNGKLVKAPISNYDVKKDRE